MITPELVRELQQMPSEDLRQVITFAAGIHAHRDGDGGTQIATALERVASRLRYQPRKTA